MPSATIRSAFNCAPRQCLRPERRRDAKAAEQAAQLQTSSMLPPARTQHKHNATLHACITRTYSRQSERNLNRDNHACPDADRRHDFVLFFDVTDGNPNGDPDMRQPARRP